MNFDVAPREHVPGMPRRGADGRVRRGRYRLVAEREELGPSWLWGSAAAAATVPGPTSCWAGRWGAFAAGPDGFVAVAVEAAVPVRDDAGDVVAQRGQPGHGSDRATGGRGRAYRSPDVSTQSENDVGDCEAWPDRFT